MDRKQARQLKESYREPQKLQTALRHIRRMAKCGFDNATLVFSDKKRAIRLSDQLMARGFVADIFSGHRSHIPGKILLEVQW